MQKELIGVIVPVYKVEKYIAECIESILAQTYTKFRLILVDDGTPDNAGKICDEYAKKDSRITVIHQGNKGVTRARARGVEEAEDCEWITFVDGDDTISTIYLGELHKAKNKDIDIVINEKQLYTTRISTIEYIHKLISLRANLYFSPWNKLFRRHLFTENVFDIPRDIRVGEDVIMNIRLNFNSNKKYVAVINKSIYNYRLTPQSAVHTHTTTPEYEYRFYHFLTNSIPNNEIDTYKSSTIENRYRHFISFWGYKYCVKGMKCHKFYKELKNDIKVYNYKLTFTSKAIFYSSNPIIRFLAINIKKLQKKLSNR